VGFAIEDVSALRWLAEEAARTGEYDELDLLADPDEPRDMFGMLLRVGAGPAVAPQRPREVCETR
jgi:ornithine cyclodeaminase